MRKGKRYNLANRERLTELVLEPEEEAMSQELESAAGMTWIKDTVVGIAGA